MKRIIGIVALSFLLLTACTTPKQEDVTPATDQDVIIDQTGVTDGTAEPIADTDPQVTGLQQETLTAQELLEQADSPIASRVIYFDYDSAKVSDESMALLEAHGDFIASNGNVSVTLNGHTDERGSREYNIGLGDRRAQSVRRVLLIQGASSDQIDSVSYGEEQPAELGHDEASWAKNRRVELQYSVK